MRHVLVYFCLLILGFSNSVHAQVYDSLFMERFGQWDNDLLYSRGTTTYNDVWGYEDGAGNEFAILGGTDSIFVIDVTTAPIQRIEAFAGGDTTSWRDFKTYDHYVYGVSDNTREGLIIIDMNDPFNPTKIYQDSEFFSRAHNIFIDEPNGRLYAVGTDSVYYGLVVLDIATDPENPILLKELLFSDVTMDFMTNFYIHDVYVENNIAYCSHGYSGYWIWDLTDLDNVLLLGSFNPAGSGYNHSSWMIPGGNHVVYAEEIPVGRPMSIVDISDPSTMDKIATFHDPLLAPVDSNNIAHNPYVIGDKVYVSFYEDGVHIVNISDLTNPFRIAYFDTSPSNTSYNGYRGCWGVYPFLSSGKILASDMSNGLFVLRENYNIFLPVELLDFRLRKQGSEKTKLEWSVTSEVNNDYYLIEKSTDGKHFEELKKVKSQAIKNNINTYSTEDFLSPGVSYYRLIQVDTDGRSSELGIRSIKHSILNFDVALENTLIQGGDPLVLKLSGDLDSNIQLRIISMAGEIIQSQSIMKGAYGNNRIETELERVLPSGNYLLELKNQEGFYKTEKFIFQSSR